MRQLLPSIGLILIAMFSIQYGASIAKGLFPIAGAAGMTALRVFFSALVLALVARVWKYRLGGKDLQIVALYGICLGCMNILFYFALEKIPLGVAVAIEFVGPLSVALYASRKPRDFLWILLAALGLYLLYPTDTSIENLNPVGILMALAAGFFWALYIVFGKQASLKGPSLYISAMGMVFAAVVSVPAGFIFNGMTVLDISIWPMGFAVAVLSGAIPYALEMKAMTNMPTKTFGILMSLEPVIAALMGLLFLKEVLAPAQWGAIFLIMVASAGSATTSKTEVPGTLPPLVE